MQDERGRRGSAAMAAGERMTAPRPTRRGLVQCGPAAQTMENALTRNRHMLGLCTKVGDGVLAGPLRRGGR
jgi:hypothetical protein